MNKRAIKAKSKGYPDQTVGSKLAAAARKMANALTDEERAECLEGAKALIYGRTRTKQVAGSRR